ncbi:molybdate ABC transporter substrate-binding protein [Aquimarina sp. BL5]|uniref:molybdate ABC transporter substrate-binding protein n=1 Tax=Aquimarina sp. BL5 TaxID=1714860 RepID=UPI000E49FA74|nr:molybdate ABC transporter substrate-binding protein [Aquimarina sp. BL5]AXT52744.1 molybdate ABC transporter substrate-binding protein [Aquimarina sp. BL5]RKN00006.1 molybdate ABC transporter substrate-binding protein [Aquimarina sp. BL5]
MPKPKVVTTISIIILLLLLGCKPSEKGVITIAAAANMQFAIGEISKIFTKQTGIQCELVISSSGKLTAQIKEGAPYDVFVSANMKYPEEIHANDLAVRPPKIYGYGQLVLWSMYDNIQPSIEMLKDQNIKHIALANPKTAPYGQAAIEVLENNGMYNQVKGKLVYGESIAQTNQFITSKSSEIGFTAKSVVLSPKMKGNGHWIALDERMYSLIEQGVVMIKRENRNFKNAQQFYDFLFSKEAKEILEDFGYLVTK